MHTNDDRMQLKLPPIPDFPPISPLGRFKQSPEDFVVEELLGWEPDGKMAHTLLQLRKSNLNTEELREALAQASNIDANRIGYCGLKDKQAVAIQWFSIPGAHSHEAVQRWIDNIRAAGIDVALLDVRANSRALSPGNHKANSFRITLRKAPETVWPPNDTMAQNLRYVPNYFGAQRFGDRGFNWEAAIEWVENGTPPRRKTVLARHLGVLRAGLFNSYVDQRVLPDSEPVAVQGDYVQFARKRAGFPVDTKDLASELDDRIRSGELSPTGPLYGAEHAKQRLLAPWRVHYDRIREQYPAVMDTLDRLDSLDRRPLWVHPSDIQVQIVDSNLQIEFVLPVGAYATVALATLLQRTQAVQE